MRAAVLMRCDADPWVPGTCAACGRRATGIGVQGPRRGMVAWVCSVPCLEPAKALAMMKAHEIDRVEEDACKAAAAVVTEAILTDVFGALWDAGARDLASVGPEQVEAAVEALAKGSMGGHVQASLKAFGDAVRGELKDGVPF